MNGENELISIIMPAHNAEKTLPLAVNSVLAQTYQNYELIIINDCSHDRTLALAEQYAHTDSRISVLSNAENIGVSQTRHKGVESARGEWLAFLDSDDAWTSDKLEKQMILQRQKNAKFIFTGSAFMDDQDAPINWIMHVPEKIGYRRLLKQNLVSNSSVLIQKSCYLEHEFIGNGLHEDFVCWLRLLRSGEAAYGIDEPLLIYRLSSSSKSGNKLKAAKMNWNAYRAAGLNVLEASYYMVWYVANGLRKYRNLR